MMSRLFQESYDASMIVIAAEPVNREIYDVHFLDQDSRYNGHPRSIRETRRAQRRR